MKSVKFEAFPHTNPGRKTMKLDSIQRKVAADIAGNIATAWFAGGVIGPIFIKSNNLSEIIVPLAVGIGMAGLFSIIALYLAKGAK